MRLIADLHIHSRFSRATSRDLDFVTLHRAALEKGLGLIGTGDFTHPGWMQEIRAQLVPDETGVLRLRPELARKAEQGLPKACSGSVGFVLEVEIANIYKKDGRVRKNHNLVFVPTLEAAQRLTDRLAAVGNLASDGRPILGLDARDLLSMTLDCDPSAFLVPAHIWTPWFSLLGSKSGFDSLDECFGDLSGEVFAAETGLSSDPAMNWRVSGLDRLTLVSNSDAHSAANLAREANILDIDPTYAALRDALKTRTGFVETVEFFPEEGKYHLDGHRACEVRLEPSHTRELGGRCPQCGSPVTVGVLSRVLDLADRPEGAKPGGAIPFRRLVPLAETVGEALGVGPGSRKVRTRLNQLLAELGPELVVLLDAPLGDVARAGGPLLSEAVRRVRESRLTIAAGYDGEFGTVHIFDPQERRRLEGQLGFLAVGSSATPQPHVAPRRDASRAPRAADPPLDPSRAQESAAGPALFDADQAQAIAASAPVLVVAGPGTGKTHTLVGRIVAQLTSGAARPERTLAVTFTNQAAEELRARIRRALPRSTEDAPLVVTFHGLGRWLLREMGQPERGLVDDDARLALVRDALGARKADADVAHLLERISLAKQTPEPQAFLAGGEDLREAYQRYEALLLSRGLIDVDDLVLRPVQILSTNQEQASRWVRRFDLVCVDEYQDVNDVQAALIRQLQPDGRALFAIGDPDQAIYGFRGAQPGHFRRFAQAYPRASVVRLHTSYRLTQPVLAVAERALGRSSAIRSMRPGPLVEIVACPTPESEAEQILVRLERLLGGSSAFAVDTGRGREAEMPHVGFGDMAVLTRTKAQRAEILEALGRSGIPCHAVGEDEPHDPRSQKVAVMTMHAAKGREFEVVFVAGAEAGLVPLDVDGRLSDVEEERRLLYVAITRARQLLVLSHAARRVLWGRRLAGGPSSFLTALPDDAVLRTSPVLPHRRTQLKLF